MNAVLISIQPKWCEKIASGRKTMELRKSLPKLEIPFKVYIYCTKGNCSIKTPNNMVCHINGGGVVIGEFVCDYILRGCHMANADIAEAQSCVRREDIFQYSNGKEVYGWHISALVIYDEPKALREFTRYSEDDIRPCQQNPYYFCQHEYFDYGENCTACAIDFDGEACPYIKVQRPPQSWCYVQEACDD